MKLQNLTVIFIIIIIPIILILSLYISTGLKTLKYQSLYDSALLTATHDAIYAYEINTANDKYSSNAETKRDILKSSVKMFEKSLVNSCGISSYNSDDIEENIPAIVFGMYDGFYMYAPSYNSQTGRYEHDLKNYVYYSETLNDGTTIIYSLDNYVIVSGNFGLKDGYLIAKDNWDNMIYEDDTSAKAYYDGAVIFTEWFNNEIGINADYLEIDSDNDPEDENSAFVQNKRKIIKEKMESVLNSSITAYSKRIWGQSYKMPKLTEEDWEKIYTNISMLTFFQNKNIGLTQYNGYCVLNSTNHNDFANPNLMYFIDESGEYHDIRCAELLESSGYSKGYKVGYFQKKKEEQPKTDENGIVLKDNNGNVEYEYVYVYNNEVKKKLACYGCINGQLYGDHIKDDNGKIKKVYEYISGLNNESNIKKSYLTSLARERYETTKVLNKLTITNTTEIKIKMNWAFDPTKIDNDYIMISLVNNMNGDIIEIKISTDSASKKGDYYVIEHTEKGLNINKQYEINKNSIKRANGEGLESHLGLNISLSKNENVWEIEISCPHELYTGNDHECDICGKMHEPDWEHDGGYSSHWCSNCNIYGSHDWSNGKCTICGASHNNHFWEQKEDGKHKCRECGLTHKLDWEHDGGYSSHWCSNCNIYGSHDWSNGKCTICGASHYYHNWNKNGNGTCTTCEASHNCYEWNEGTCTTCGASHNDHAWDNGTCRICEASCNNHQWLEHRCMECYLTHEPVWDYYRDYKYCTICGLW